MLFPPSPGLKCIQCRNAFCSPFILSPNTWFAPLLWSHTHTLITTTLHFLCSLPTHTAIRLRLHAHAHTTHIVHTRTLTHTLHAQHAVCTGTHIHPHIHVRTRLSSPSHTWPIAYTYTSIRTTHTHIHNTYMHNTSHTHVHIHLHTHTYPPPRALLLIKETDALDDRVDSLGWRWAGAESGVGGGYCGWGPLSVIRNRLQSQAIVAAMKG